MDQSDESSRSTTHVRQLRLVVTTDHFDTTLAYFRDVLGMPALASYSSESGNVVILEGGLATLEIADRGHAEYIDRLEVGERVAGQIRLAIEVDDVEHATEASAEHGKRVIAPPVETPWGSTNARLEDSEGLHMTLFQEPTSSD